MAINQIEPTRDYQDGLGLESLRRHCWSWDGLAQSRELWGPNRSLPAPRKGVARTQRTDLHRRTQQENETQQPQNQTDSDFNLVRTGAILPSTGQFPAPGECWHTVPKDRLSRPLFPGIPSLEADVPIWRLLSGKNEKRKEEGLSVTTTKQWRMPMESRWTEDPGEHCVFARLHPRDQEVRTTSLWLLTGKTPARNKLRWEIMCPPCLWGKHIFSD